MGMSELVETTENSSQESSPYKGDANDVFIQTEIEQLRESLEITERCHHQYETILLKGVRDEGWAEWYAAFLFINTGIRNLLPALSEIKLVIFLKKLPSSENRPWAEFAAEQLVANFGKESA